MFQDKQLYTKTVQQNLLKISVCHLWCWIMTNTCGDIKYMAFLGNKASLKLFFPQAELGCITTF